MGINSALNTAVNGLSSQAFALEQISGNIANTETLGYKRTETSFQDLVTESSSTRQDGAGVRVETRGTNDVQGDIVSSASPTFMAINGDGYFIVGDSNGVVDGRATFDDTDLYTRRGDFERNSEGYLVNGGGYFLKGVPVNEATGNTVGSEPALIQVTNDLLAARATTTIEYRANIPSYPFTSEADPDTAGTELIDPIDYANDPTVAGDGFVQAIDSNKFINQSISGGAITTYVNSGADANLQFRWAKVDSTTGSETWNLFFLEDSAATGANPAWRNAGQNFIFDSGGNLTTPVADTITLTGISVNGVALGNLTMDFGSDGLTQFDDNDGSINIVDMRQDGFPAGEFNSVSVSDSGRVVISYSNGENVDLAEVTLATFNADNRLEKRDGGAFVETSESGIPILTSGTSVIGSAVESSNAEVADEFTKLITTQQAYSANSRIISAADEMIDEVLNIVR